MINSILKNDLYELNIKENFVHLKNYKNIIDIYPDRISILVNSSKIVINGSNLIICALDEYEMLIKGIIRSISFSE